MTGFRTNVNGKKIRIDGGAYTNFFYTIYNNLSDYNIKQSDKIVFGCIVYACELNDGLCKWSNESMCNNTGLSRSQLIESIGNLKKAGLITTGKNNKGSRYIKISEDYEYDDRYLQIWVSVLRDDRLSINDKFVFSAIRSLANAKFKYRCFSNNTMIASIVGCSSINTVKNSIIKLQKLGIIEVETKDKKNRCITIKQDLADTNRMLACDLEDIEYVDIYEKKDNKLKRNSKMEENDTIDYDFIDDEDDEDEIW